MRGLVKVAQSLNEFQYVSYKKYKQLHEELTQNDNKKKK